MPSAVIIPIRAVEPNLYQDNDKANKGPSR